MNRMFFVLAIACLTVGSFGAGCTPAEDGARSAGPNADEENLVTYWRVTGSSALNSGCTDSGDWASVTEPIEFGDNSFLMYMLDSGGATATGQSCGTTAASSCSDSDTAWTVTGNTLVYEPAAISIPGDGTCGYELDVVWSVVDAGVTGILTVDMSFRLVPDDGTCDYFEQAVVDGGTNGFGLETCSIQTSVQMDFEKAEAR